jgi:hypothetical protein
MERVDQGTVLPVRATISTERKKIEDMQGGLVGSKVGVAVGTNKNNKEKIPKGCEHGVTEQWVAVSTITSGIHPM